MSALSLVKLDGCLRCWGKESAKNSQETYNYVILNVTNVHQVKVNDRMIKANGTQVHAIFQVCCIASILLLII